MPASRQNRILYVAATLTVYLCSTICGQELFTINPDGAQKPISPYIYGVNAISMNPEIYAALSDLNLGSDRLGGNRLTGYNWETNHSHAGNDWKHSNDFWLAQLPLKAETGPLGTLRSYFEHNRSQGRYAIIQLPMAGFVSADGTGPVEENEAAPSSRWKQVVFSKNSPFSLNPDLNDESVYVDECVWNLVQLYGAAEQGGVKAYCLDNEPGLWDGTHPRIHPDKATGAEIIEKSARLAAAIKAVDESAEIFGLESWGYWEMHDFTGASDWDQFSGTYDWAISAFLGEMKKKSDEENKRLIDVLAIHWYPEARGDGKRITGQDTTAGAVEARLQAPRSLWDSTYVEDSWLMDITGNKPLYLLPRVRESIVEWYPETKLAVTEYSYGASGHWSGALALADVLGIYAREEVYAANLHVPPVDFLAQAIKLYRNIDGYYNGFGDIYIPSNNPDSSSYSVYSSLNSKDDRFLHVIVINKKNTDIEALLQIEGTKQYISGVVFGLAQGDTELEEKENFSAIQNNSFTYTLPKHSMLHFVLSTENQIQLPQPVFYTLNTEAVGSGNISRSVETSRIKEGTEVELTASAAPGWTFAGWSGDETSQNQTVTVTMNSDLDIQALFVSTDELMENGDFSDGKNGWTFSTWSEDNSSEGSAVVENGALKYTVENGGPEAWNVQFFQNNIPLIKGVSYLLTFEAWAESEDSVNVYLGNHGGYGNVSGNKGLTTEPQVFTIPFVMDSASDPSARLSFDVGGSNRQGVFYFDNISLKANSTSTVSRSYSRANNVSATITASIGKTLKLSIDSGGRYNVRLFDLKGRQIKEVFNGHLPEGDHSLELPVRLGAGTFIVKVSSETEEAFLKFRNSR